MLGEDRLLWNVAKEMPARFGNRLLFGIELNSLDDAVVGILDKNAELPSERIKILTNLQDREFNNYVLLRPTTPVNAQAYAQALSATKVLDNCDEIWIELSIPQGNALVDMANRLREGGQMTLASALEVCADPAQKEEYERCFIETFRKTIGNSIDSRLHFIHTPSATDSGWWKHLPPEKVIITTAKVENEQIQD